MMKKNKLCCVVNIIAIVSGVLLLAISIYGKWFYEYALVPSDRWAMGVEDRVISTLTIDELRKRDEESDQEYFSRLTKSVNQYMIHFWPLDDIERQTYGINIPIWENYMLWALGKTGRSFGGANEYLDPERALRRGYGLCSQHAIILAKVLNDEGYRSKLIQLTGHIVATVEDTSGQWSVLDADYGVFMPHDIHYLEKNPKLIESYYREVMLRIPKNIRLPMMEIYQTENDNVVVDVAEKVGAKGFFIINFTMYAIWVIPLFLIVLPLLLSQLWPCRKEKV